MFWWLIPILAIVLAAGVVGMVKWRRKPKPEPTEVATYGGPIRFTDPSGRNMKIIQKDDGSFEMMEE